MGDKRGADERTFITMSTELMQTIAKSLYCTPETNITLRLLY